MQTPFVRVQLYVKRNKVKGWLASDLRLKGFFFFLFFVLFLFLREERLGHVDKLEVERG